MKTLREILSESILESSENKDFEVAFKKFMGGARKIFIDNKPDILKNTEDLDYEVGKKYIRIMAVNKSHGGRSAFGFINKENGDVLKADGWKKPAKGIRGNIFDKENGLGRVSPYSVK